MTTTSHSAEPRVIRPGDLLNLYEYLAIRDEYASAAGLDPGDVLITPYGYPPLPRPPTQRPDGTGKLPAGLAVEFSGHPVYWLDPATKRQPPDEPDDAYAIRLYLELVDRGYSNPADGRLRNPLVGAGIDVRRPADRARLEAYTAGAWDTELCELVIPPNPETPAGVLATEAARLHHIHAEGYQTLLDTYRQHIDRELRHAQASINHADFDADAAPLIAAAETMRQAAATGEDHLPARAELGRHYRRLVARIAQLDAARISITIHHDLSTSRGEPPPPAAAYVDGANKAAQARTAALEPHISAVYMDPTDTARLSALLRALRSGYSEALAAAQTTLAAYPVRRQLDP